jgi:hypothetical protein
MKFFRTNKKKRNKEIDTGVNAEERERSRALARRPLPCARKAEKEQTST